MTERGDAPSHFSGAQAHRRGYSIAVGRAKGLMLGLPRAINSLKSIGRKLECFKHSSLNRNAQRRRYGSLA
jgi:hypothetical protein